MIRPNPVPAAILGINFLKVNKVVINLTERRFERRRDGPNCEHKFCDSLPMDKWELPLYQSEISTEI
jgi:hypothetical protein